MIRLSDINAACSFNLSYSQFDQRFQIHNFAKSAKGHVNND